MRYCDWSKSPSVQIEISSDFNNKKSKLNRSQSPNPIPTGMNPKVSQSSSSLINTFQLQKGRAREGGTAIDVGFFDNKETHFLIEEHRRRSLGFFGLGFFSCCSMGYANGIVSAQGRQPLVSFGVISDVQYADIPDGRSFLGVPRYYRHSLLVLQRAVKKWNEQQLKFVINFGDTVDGFCPKDQSLTAVNKIVNEFSIFNGPVYHMIGNHCLYNLPREKLLPILNIHNRECRAYYEFSPIPEYRFLVLDGYDISAIGWPMDHPNTLKALNFLKERNPNSDKNSPNGLLGLDRRFLMFNGGVGKEQMEWLDRVLQDATKVDQKVIICCHLPLDPGASSNEALLWNHKEVMDLIHHYKCVKVCIAGHDHKGGYCVDSHGVHHRVLEAALECPPSTNAFGRIDLFHDRLLLCGTDRMGTTEMVFS